MTDPARHSRVTSTTPRTPPTRRDVRRWRQYLADERAEAAVYRELAGRREGEERAILLALAEAEGRHEAHWLALLGDDAGRPRRGNWRTVTLALLARRFGSIFVLALAQQAEARSQYEADVDATPTMAADERVHEEVVRGLAARGRARISGTLRAAVFGANDGLVSNLALVAGIGASGASQEAILLTGLAGLLAGALSMGAGEYVSVRSQVELLAASHPNPATASSLGHLDLDRNELALVYRARGMSPADAEERAAAVLTDLASESPEGLETGMERVAAHVEAHEVVGSGWNAALSSFCFFAIGAVVPVLPFLAGMTGTPAIVAAAVVVGVMLLVSGAIVGVLSGAPPLRRALRQLGIGLGAAAVTYLLGLAFA